MSQEEITIKCYTDEEFCNDYSELYEKAGYHYGDKIDKQKRREQNEKSIKQ